MPAFLPPARPHILHLVDDTTPGGVMRVLDHIRSDPGLARLATHDVREIPRSAIAAPALRADVIVSHLAIRWRGLPFLMALRARHATRPMVHVEHSYTGGFAAHRVTARGRFTTLLRTAYALFDRVAAVSAGQRDWLAARGLVEWERLRLLRSTVDVAPFLALPLPDGPARVVGAIGRLNAQKGFDILIRALRSLPDTDLQLAIIGDGPERAALEALADDDPRIRFHGHSPDPVAAMAGVDAVAMPSRWEAYGLVGLEARAAGRPLLCAGVDGLEDHIRAGALRVGPGVADWAAALAGLDHARDTTHPRRAAAAEPAAFARAWADLLGELTRDTTPARSAA